MRPAWIAAAIVALSATAALPWFDGLSARAESAKDGASKVTSSRLESNKRINKVDLPAFTAEREAAAITFVKMHHGELADLLARLKQHNRPEYEQAIRELFRTSERLAQWQEKNPHKYETELKTWQLGSRIQVLTAKLAMNADPVLKQELRDALQEQQQLRRSQLQTERERTAARLAELDRELQKDMNVSVDERLDQLVQGTQERKKQRETKSSETKAGANKSESSNKSDTGKKSNPKS
ncbi:MAG: hypothetical protein JNM18_05310 [Planctomycetaceae bacterium]|nr:hypothetical protein [Planctomycetaceae bacterium]